MFSCCDGVEMVLASKQCNGYPDCKDGSDEFYCNEGKYWNMSPQFIDET